jgi:chromosomal replication initiation ATPase DnaA
MNYDDLLILRQNTIDSLKRIDRLLSAFESTPSLTDMLPEKRMEYIILTICNYASIEINDILAGNQSTRNTLWRKIATYILKKYGGMRGCDIARRLEYKSDAAVYAIMGKMDYWMEHPAVAPKDIYFATINILNQLGYEKE